MNKSLQINVLGGFQAVRDGEELRAFSNRKGQALLAYLAVEGRRAHSREALASLLWARTGEDRARHNLRQSLAKVRSALGDVVTGGADQLRLDAATCDTDVGLFEGWAASGDAADLQRALDLYRGELVEGLNPREEAFADWLSTARARLRQAACTVASRLAQAYESQGSPDLAIAALERLLELEPADENGHRRLIRLLASQGRRSDALRQYQRCVDALRRELATEPDSETRALHRQLQAHQSGDSPGAAVEPGPSSGAGRAPAVAVLPFDNLSGEDDRYFVDGIAEDLTTALSSFHSLVVIARGSSFTYRGRDVPEKRIASELGAQYLVRGSVQRADRRVRINVQLMDAGAGLQIWGHRYDREMEDVFVLQDEITSTLVCTLAGRVEAARLSYARRAAPERLDAYDLLLRGKDHHHRFTAEDCAMCIEMFRRAIERDPDYAVAHAWLACGIGQAMVFGLGEIPKLVDQSQAAAERGLELDENESECHRILAQVQLTRRDLDRALWHQERALLLNPNDDRIVCAQGEILAFVGRAQEAERWVRRSMRLNPYHPERYWTHLARALFHQGQFEEALAALDNIGRPRTDDLCYRAAAAEMVGDEGAASAAARELVRRQPGFAAGDFIAASAYTVDEFRDALAAPLDAALRRLPRGAAPAGPSD